MSENEEIRYKCLKCKIDGLNAESIAYHLVTEHNGEIIEDYWVDIGNYYRTCPNCQSKITNADEWCDDDNQCEECCHKQGLIQNLPFGI